MNKTDLITKLKESTLDYKNSFKVVENICDNNYNIMGCIAQVNSALRNIERNETTIVIPEAIICANFGIKMEFYQNELRNIYKIPHLDVMGFCGDILSSDIVGYKSYGKPII